MSLSTLILSLALAQSDADPRSALPLTMTLDEPRPQEGQDRKQEPFPPSPTAAPKSAPIVDLEWLELTGGVGVAVFSHQYLANPSGSVLISAHAPLPWLSPASDPKGEYFGLFLEAAFATIDRDLSPTIDHRRGVAAFTTLGMDYSFIRDSFWVLVGRAGVLYAYYGDIAQLNSGVGGTLGAAAGIQISGKMALTYQPEAFFGKSGSLIFLNTLAFTFQF
jgi:hypothetical protein